MPHSLYDASSKVGELARLDEHRTDRTLQPPLPTATPSPPQPMGVVSAENLLSPVRFRQRHQGEVIDVSTVLAPSTSCMAGALQSTAIQE